MFTYFWHVFDILSGLKKTLLVTYVSPILRFSGLEVSSRFADPQDLWQKCPGNWWNHDNKSWTFIIISEKFLRTWWAYDKDFRAIDEFMTEDPRNKNGRMSTNPRRYCRIEYHQKLRKFQEDSGMFGRNYFARSFLDFWSSIPRNIRDFWSFFKEVRKNFKTLSIPKQFCHNPWINKESEGIWSLFHQFPSIFNIGNAQAREHDRRHTHTKADQRKRSNNYTKITQLIPSELFLCNLCVCNLEINSPIFFLCV